MIKSDSDKIPFYCCLAWLYMRQLREAPVKVPEGESGENVKTKQLYHKLATEVGNKAYALSTTWSVTVLARGALTLAVGDFDNALQPFQSILSQSGNANLLAQLGRARVLYQKKNYKGALKLYQSVLNGRPNMKPDPRIGIGLCFWKLDDKSTARLAWERSVELDSENPAALSLLGLYYMDRAMANVDSSNFQRDYAFAMKFIQAAYKTNSNYSSAALVLSSYFYSKEDMDKVIQLCNKVLDYSDVPSLISDGYFWMGRAYHNLADYDKALEYYQLSENKSKQMNLLPMIGKGLIQMTQGSSEALLTFEHIVGANPKSAEALLLLGLLTAQRAGSNNEKEKIKAISILEKYLRLAKEQNEVPPIEASLTLSKLCEGSNNDKSLNCLEEIIDKHELQGVSVQVYNNIGVFNYLNGNYEVARTSFEKAMNILKGSDEELVDSSYDSEQGEKLLVTLAFNLARLEDASGKIEDARTGYKKVLELRENYLDAQIRLAYLDLIFAESEVPSDAVEELMKSSDDNLGVRALYGWFLRRRKRSSKNTSDDAEQRHYKKSLIEWNKHDNYSLVAMGNIYLAVAREMKVGNAADAEKKEKTYFKASELFDKALRIDPYNAFAAQGIAIIFAETKRANLALQVFGKIRETLNDISIYINMGHCFCELKQHDKAVESYELALKRFKNGKDPQLMTLLGRAWYARGVNEKSLEGLRVSLDYSERAFDLLPDNQGLKFNVAFVKFQIASLIQRLPEDKRSLADIEQVARGLEEAIISLNEVSKTKYPPYPPNDLEQRALMGQNTLRKQLDRAIEAQTEYEEGSKHKLEEARKVRLQEQERLDEARRKAAEAEEARQKKLAEERKQLREQAREWVERALEEAEKDDMIVEEKKTKPKKEKEPKEKKSKSGRRKKSALSSEFVTDEEDEEEEEEEDVQVSDEEQSAEESDSSDSRKRKAEEEVNPATDDAEFSATKKRRVNRIADSDDEDENNADVEDKNGAANDEELFG